MTRIAAEVGEHVADTEHGLVEKRLRAAAKRLRDEALANPNPSAENTAPAHAQQEIIKLKLGGWFPQRELVRAVMGTGNPGKLALQNGLDLLIQIGVLVNTEVTWATGSGKTQRRAFCTITE